MDANKWFYLSYLLRLWPVDATSWRASLEDPRSGERHGFATLEGLFAFLQTQTATAPESADERQEHQKED